MRRNIKKITLFLQEGKQVMLGFMSGIIVALCFVTSSSYMNASVNVNDGASDQKTIEITNKQLISDEAQILARNIISDEADVEDLVGEEEELELTSAEESLDDLSLDFMTIGQGTLVKGKALPNISLLIITKSGTECRAQSSATGKFGCMFSKEIIGNEDLHIMY